MLRLFPKHHGKGRALAYQRNDMCLIPSHFLQYTSAPDLSWLVKRN